MKKVLEIVPTLGYGGISSMVMNYYYKIDKARFQVDFVTHGDVEDFHANIINDGGTIFYLQTMRKMGIIGYYSKLSSIILSGKYDVVHFHSCGPRLLILPFIRKKAKCKIVLHSHSTKKGRWPVFLWRWFSLRYADELLACGHEAGIAAYGKNSNFKIIPNAIDISRFSRIVNRDTKYREEFFSDNIAVIHIGAFIEQKNHAFIVEMARQIKDRKLNIRIVCVGQGPLFDKTQEAIEKHNIQSQLVLLGKRNDVNRLLANSDCFILPSLYEGLPVSGIEAQFSGCLCLFSNTISRETDQKFGNSRFLSLDKSDYWIDEILASNRTAKPEEELLEKSLYNINNSVKLLEGIYAK